MDKNNKQTPEEKKLEANARRRIAAAVKRTDAATNACKDAVMRALRALNALPGGGKAAEDRLGTALAVADIYLRAADRASSRAARVEYDTSKAAGPYGDPEYDIDVPLNRIAGLAPARRLPMMEKLWKQSAGYARDRLAEVERYAAQVMRCIGYAEGRRDGIGLDPDEYVRLKAEDAERQARWKAGLAELKAAREAREAARTGMSVAGAAAVREACGQEAEM